MKSTCPFCESGELKPRVTDRTINYGGDQITVRGLLSAACDECDMEVVLQRQEKHNDKLYADAKRAHDGLLSSTQIYAWRTVCNLTQATAAKLLGGGPNAFSKYERGETIQSKPMDLLMRAYERIPALRLFLAEQAGLEGIRSVDPVVFCSNAQVVHVLSNCFDSKLTIPELCAPTRDYIDAPTQVMEFETFGSLISQSFEIDKRIRSGVIHLSNDIRVPPTLPEWRDEPEMVGYG